MAQTDRPGGLIALSVINFVFCAVDGLVALVMLFTLVALQFGQSLMVDRDQRNPGTAAVVIDGGTTTVSATASARVMPEPSTAGAVTGIDAALTPRSSSASSVTATGSTTTTTATTTTYTYNTTGDDDEPAGGARHHRYRRPLFTAQQTAQVRLNTGVTAASCLLCSVLLLLSGIGYIRQLKVLGRYLGTCYAVVALASLAVQHMTDLHEFGHPSHGLGILTIIQMIYPVLTLILLNTVFKDDLAR